MRSKKSISVIIPNYNGVELLPNILPNLYAALDFYGAHHEVIIVDDRSSDLSVAYIRKNYPRVLLMENDYNIGFSASVNEGLKAATCDLVFILNSDVKLERDYFVHQIKYFRREDTFGVNGTIINWHDDDLQGGGKILSRQGFKIKSNTNYYLNAKRANFNKPFYSMFLTGTNALVDRKKMLEIGGFTPLFSPYYVEDVELSIRAWRLGWKCYYEPKSLCRHELSVTIKKHQRKKYIYTINARNKLCLHALHLEGGNLVGWWCQTSCELLFRILTFNFSYVRAFAAFLGNYKELLRAKNQFKGIMEQKNQHIGVFKLFERLNADIETYKALKVTS